VLRRLLLQRCLFGLQLLQPATTGGGGGGDGGGGDGGGGDAEDFAAFALQRRQQTSGRRRRRLLGRRLGGVDDVQQLQLLVFQRSFMKSMSNWVKLGKTGF